MIKIIYDRRSLSKCGASLAEITETANGRRLQRCSKGSWNKETRQNEGCDYVKWLEVEPQTLDEKCPKCGSPLILQVTRFGKKMKKCSAGSWDKETEKQSGAIMLSGLTAQLKKLMKHARNAANLWYFLQLIPERMKKMFYSRMGQRKTA